MKTIVLTLAVLVGSASAASAHTLRNSDGSPREHDHSEAFQLVDGVRLVSATLAPGADCKAATWPDIPTSCLERVAPGQPVQQAEAPLSEVGQEPSMAPSPDTAQRVSVVLPPASITD